ncbi:MAG: hypothetical protein MJ105_09940 [Lachnospiraceae bacterium]|nr:hypothetical protein [Lachnospiraceae bacterium]MCQ2522681.1 hypothetical protein [Lachnospiraceae bacterium]
MLEILITIDELAVIGSLLLLFVFSFLLPRTNIAKYLYMIFGISICIFGVYEALRSKPWYEFVLYFIFGIAAAVMGIVLFVVNKKVQTKEEQEALDEAFGKASGRRKN